MSEKIYLTGAVRTPIGKFGGALANISASTLGAIVIKESLRRAGINQNDVDEVIMGCVIQASQGQNVARQAALTAGIKNETPAITINNVCGSGLKSINMAASEILAGNANIIVVGGMENMSQAPYVLEKARFGYRLNDGKLVDTLINDALWDFTNNYHMGMTAENIAVKYNISRQQQDEFAANSQQKCEKARELNLFKDEIVPVEIKGKKGTEFFSDDEYPRNGVLAEDLAKLSPAFLKDGTVTAANASGINDGAAALIVISESAVKKLGIIPMAVWVGGSWAGVDPAYMGLGPIASTKKLLSKLNYTIDDIDLIEANEAFAAQAIAVGMELGIDNKKLNVNGGAISLGHPVGASGCRIMVTLLHEMARRNVDKGLATLCVGGGMGVSTIVENFKTL